MSRQFRGVMTALVTPFREDESFDDDAMRKLVEFQVESGVDGLVVCGSTGEAATLNDEEYRMVVKTVVDAVAGRLPVVAGAGSNNTSRAIELSRIAEDCGVDGLLHVTPFYNKPTTKGLIAHFSRIAAESQLPIIAYNVPGRTGSNVAPSVLLRLAYEVPSVVAVKEASGDVAQIMQIIAERHDDFTVLSGDDNLALPLLSAGADGIISVVSNEIPSEYADLVHAALDGDYKRAREIHYEWLDLMQANFYESNPIPVKTALAHMGLCREVLRLPLTPMEDDTKTRLISVLERHGR